MWELWVAAEGVSSLSIVCEGCRQVIISYAAGGRCREAFQLCNSGQTVHNLVYSVNSGTCRATLFIVLIVGQAVQLGLSC